MLRHWGRRYETDTIWNDDRLDAVGLRRQSGDKATYRRDRFGTMPDRGDQWSDETEKMICLFRHAARHISQVHSQDIGNAGEEACH